MFDIITVGSATRDVYLKSPNFKYLKHRAFKTGRGVCFDLGSKIGVEDIYFTTGGSAINTAISFSRLGFRVATIARIGDDARGRELVRILKEERVATSFLQKDKRHGTAYSLLLLSPSGERTILTYRGATEDISKYQIPLSRLHTQWLYISHLAGTSKALFKPLLDFADRHNIRIALNPGSTQLQNSETWWKRVLRRVDVLLLNREEASYLTRVPFQNEHGIFEKLDKWVRGVVAMTEGPKGALVSDGLHRWRAGALKEKRIVDRTGAGDAFGAGFVAAMMELQRGRPREDELEYAVQLASANATSQIEKLGSRDGLLRKGAPIYRWGKIKLKKL